MQKINIVFMGTPEFAVTILKTLNENENVNVLATLTAPDKPAGRGQKINKSAVKLFSEANNLRCLQPTNLKETSFVEELQEINADLFVVVAFRMLPEIVWNMPSKGTINLHASLLPQYRGAAPINWAVINGEEKTGVTTFFIEQEIDTGLVIEQEAIAIQNTDTAGDLHDKLMHLGAKLTLQSVLKIAKGEVERTAQSLLLKGELKSAPKIFKPDCKINFEQPALTVHNFIRGLSPYPTAWFKLIRIKDNLEKTVKVFSASICDETTQHENIELIIKDKSLLVLLNSGYLEINELQLEGKKRLKAEQFILGFTPTDWKIADY